MAAVSCDNRLVFFHSDGQGVQRAGRGEPARRALRQWKTTARDHTQEDSGTLTQWRTPV